MQRATLTTILGEVVAFITGLGVLLKAIPDLFAGATGLKPWGLFALGMTALVVAVRLVAAQLSMRSRLLRPDLFEFRIDATRRITGRDEELETLHALCETCPLVFVEGESGSGKSALIEAGLIPQFQDSEHHFPIYFYLAGAAWEEGLDQQLYHLVWHSLSAQERTECGLESPTDPDPSLHNLFLAMRDTLHKNTTIFFDQFDDYQSAHTGRFRQNGAWVTSKTLCAENSFWKNISNLIKRSVVSVVFVTRSDAAAGLDTVRFAEARIFRLLRLETACVVPIIEQLATSGDPATIIVKDPDHGWNALKLRLLEDLSEDGFVLPMQFCIALHGLKRLRFLTVYDYEINGGLQGLERLYLEDTLKRAASLCKIHLSLLLNMLLLLIDQVNRKTKAEPFSTLFAAIEPSGNPTETHPIHDTLKYLESRKILRRYGHADIAAEQLWSLHHDFLSRGILEVWRNTNRYQFLLQERQKAYLNAHSLGAKWRALLSPFEQVNLLLRRVDNRFQYKETRAFACKSLVRFLPAIVLVAGCMLFGVQLNKYSEKREADAIFNSLGAVQYAPMSPLELPNIKKLAAGSSYMKECVLRRAFAGGDDSAVAITRIEVLLHTCLGFDSTGKFRQRLWSKIILPQLEGHKKDINFLAVLAASLHSGDVPGEAVPAVVRVFEESVTGKSKSEIPIIMGLSDCADIFSPQQLAGFAKIWLLPQEDLQAVGSGQLDYLVRYLSQEDLTVLAQRLVGDADGQVPYFQVIGRIFDSFSNEQATAVAGKIVATWKARKDVATRFQLARELEALAPKVESSVLGPIGDEAFDMATGKVPAEKGGGFWYFPKLIQKGSRDVTGALPTLMDLVLKQKAEGDVLRPFFCRLSKQQQVEFFNSITSKWDSISATCGFLLCDKDICTALMGAASEVTVASLGGTIMQRLSSIDFGTLKSFAYQDQNLAKNVEVVSVFVAQAAALKKMPVARELFLFFKNRVNSVPVNDLAFYYFRLGLRFLADTATPDERSEIIALLLDRCLKEAPFILPDKLSTLWDVSIISKSLDAAKKREVAGRIVEILRKDACLPQDTSDRWWVDVELIGILKEAEYADLILCLKEPFAIGGLQHLLLKAIGSKFNEEFDGSIWAFSKWARANGKI